MATLHTFVLRKGELFVIFYLKKLEATPLGGLQEDSVKMEPDRKPFYDKIS
jgi:hypothetical protein